MKKVNKFLLLLTVLALTGGMSKVMAQPKGIPEILGEYNGDLHVVSSTFMLDATYDDVTMELRNSTTNYAIEVAPMNIEGIELPAYALEDVVITQSGSKYTLTKTGSLKITIDKINTPIGTFNNVPVEITLESGSFVENSVLTLNIKAVATVKIIIDIKVPINIGFVGDFVIPDCDPVTNAKAVIENCTTATITWNAVEGAEKYEVRRGGTILGSPTTPTFTETFAFEDGETYTWMIKTVCMHNTSTGEVAASATAACECKSVTNEKAQIENCEKATVIWDAVSGAKEYKVERNGVAPVIVEEPIYTEEATFEDGQSYTWTITTICKTSEAEEKVSVSATADCASCSPVMNEKAEIESCEKATITWNAVAGAKEYKVTRDGDTKTVSGTTYTEEATFEDGKTYTWTIVTVCDKNESDAVSVSTTANCTGCSPVTNAKATIESCETATITWDAVTGATGYKVSREGVAPITVTTPSHTETADFEDGTTYTWTIVTLCGEEESEGEEATAIATCVSIFELANTVSVYPNPANTSITIDAQGFIKVEVYNTVGQLIETQTVSTIDVSSYNTGIYFLRIHTEYGAVTKKVMKN